MQKNYLTKFNIYSWFRGKKLSKLGIEGNILNLIKGIYEKPATNIILNGEWQELSWARES